MTAAPDASHERAENRRGPEHLEAFSDGVFAIGVLVYAGTFIAIAVAFNLFWDHVRRGRGVFRPDASRRSVDSITRSYRLGPPGFLVAFVAALVNPAWGMAVIIALVIIYMLPSSSGA